MTVASPYPAAREAIRAAGLKHREVAAQMGLDPSKLSKSLSGIRKFNSQEWQRLSEITGVTVDKLQSSEVPREVAMNRKDFAARRRAIVDAAWPMFAQYGYTPVTIADIAQATGMSTAAVLYYFPSKNAIFLATLAVCSEEAAARRTFIDAIDDPAERLLAFAAVVLDGSDESKREWATWAQFWSSSPAFEDAKHATAIAYDRWQEQLRSIVKEGYERGRFDTANPEDMVNAVTAMIDGLGVRLLAGVLTPQAAHDAVTAYLNTWIKENI
ncbi:TetR family transcriptional regulator C-terminal domain-containing protein [Corynebacterium aquatimens]|uniref:AcrR family transcriptional regulator n=1 Tax=Corynebacterium aquatimens TaxID=1190508 RepID=A0A931GVP0_9CORY|nr:TetR/AcrR family transcriptional regulator [Corynebacterium aquatimens]MBG6121501.1 AcrR family transcriptional regulator [Corynebacterium aquatimens]WJY65956.1 HTH-type transcriptional regulator RutR [Corynebacterium aquatimens]